MTHSAHVTQLTCVLVASVGWSEKTGSKLQSAPGFSQFANSDRIWNLLDAAKEIATAHGDQILPCGVV